MALSTSLDPTEPTYARLPEDLLVELLAGVPAMQKEVEDLLAPALDRREEIRDHALNHLNRIKPVRPGTPRPLCAVDGGSVVEPTLAVDLLLSVAVGVEGIGPTASGDWGTGQQHAHFRRVLGHFAENDRLAGAAMIALELRLLRDAPHRFRILDGSHLTPIIKLNGAFSAVGQEVSGGIAAYSNEHALPSALKSLASDSRVVAMPKYDSSRELCDTLSKSMGIDIPGDDKYLASLILRGGEYTTPTQVARSPWGQLHIKANQEHATADSRREAKKLNDEIMPLRQRKLRVTYFRPDDLAPAYRIEFKPDFVREDGDGTDELMDLFASLASLITGPFIREPYPQYLGDVMAKSVGLGLTALHSATLSRIGRGDHAGLARYLMHSYRSEGP